MTKIVGLSLTILVGLGAVAPLAAAYFTPPAEELAFSAVHASFAHSSSGYRTPQRTYCCVEPPWG